MNTKLTVAVATLLLVGTAGVAPAFAADVALGHDYFRDGAVELQLAADDQLICGVVFTEPESGVRYYHPTPVALHALGGRNYVFAIDENTSTLDRFSTDQRCVAMPGSVVNN